jgi:hypothetical protein
MRALTAALLNGDLAGAARMKLLLSVVGILAATSMLGASAQAQNYPWCAQYCGGGLNCGFVSFEQCMDTVRGIGGFCIQNNRSPCGKLAILIGRSHLDNNSGSLAMFAAIRRASPRASGFVFSFEHLAVGLKNRHHG